MVEDHETEEDSGPKPNGDKKAKPSAEEDMGMLGEFCIVLLQVWQPRSLGERLLKETIRKVGLNLKEGMAKKGGWTSQKLVTQQATLYHAP